MHRNLLDCLVPCHNFRDPMGILLPSSISLFLAHLRISGGHSNSSDIYFGEKEADPADRRGRTGRHRDKNVLPE